MEELFLLFTIDTSVSDKGLTVLYYIQLESKKIETRSYFLIEEKYNMVAHNIPPRTN